MHQIDGGQELSPLGIINVHIIHTQMSDQRGEKRRKSARSTVKRPNLQRASVEHIRDLMNSQKGEAVHALYSIFNCDSISFETHKHTGPSGTFITFLNLKGYSFIGYGNNKIVSRAAASKIALVFFFDDIHRSDHFNYSPLTQQLVSNQDTAHSLPDITASLVLSKYRQLRNDSKHDMPWFKMIAGIVAVRNEAIRNAEVVVLATGTKCVEPKNLRLDGSVIVDSHAETLIRRCFQYFLYSQLSSTNLEETIIEKCEQKFRIKPEIRLYLYINSAPCGDARIFTVSDKDCSQDKHPNRISRGVLRIKLDGGNSTVPLTNVEKYYLKRLMVMSCSDKLLKSNSLGLQGSLLSNLIEPIYLHGIVIGDSFRKSHLTRALYERAEDVKLRSPFEVHRPIIYGLEKIPKVVTKSPKTSVNWICGTLPEIINSTTGKTISGKLSRLCKRNLFKRYIRLQNRLEDICSYESCKLKCTEYQAAKKCFYEILESKQMGKWIRRTPSLDAFIVKKDEDFDVNYDSNVVVI